MITALNRNSLLLVGHYFQSFEKDFNQHQREFEVYLENFEKVGPLLINAQTGKDYFTFDQNCLLFDLADRFSQKTGIRIAHETHRSKALFAAHVAKYFFTRNQNISITADFSHWCTVSESLLEQQQDSIDLAIRRTIHIHARIGHAQSAQVSDPRSEYWKLEVDTHLKWWDRIVQCRLEDGSELLSITPEFGPTPYMTVIPYTEIPICDQWQLNLYMMNLLKTRYRQYMES